MQLSYAIQAPVKTTGRLQAIDFLKGYAMVWIIFTHLGDYWSQKAGPASWVSLWRALFMLMDWVGPTLFIIVTVLGTMISIRNKQISRIQKGMFVSALRKSSYLFLIGELINLFIDSINKYKSGPWHFLGMNMITAVAFSQLLAYGLVMLKGRYLATLFFAMVFSFPVLFQWSYQGVTVDPAGIAILEPSTMTSIQPVIYFIFFHMESMIPAYCWILLSIATVLVFRGFVDFHVSSSYFIRKNTAGISRFMRSFQHFHAKKLAIVGGILVAFSILFGGFQVSYGVGFTIFVFKDLTNGDAFSFWTLPGVPLFLFRHVPHY
nr:hypothetical protein [Candidatus Sigynarchaeota archaeon]